MDGVLVLPILEQLGQYLRTARLWRLQTNEPPGIERSVFHGRQDHVLARDGRLGRLSYCARGIQSAPTVCRIDQIQSREDVEVCYRRHHLFYQCAAPVCLRDRSFRDRTLSALSFCDSLPALRPGNGSSPWVEQFTALHHRIWKHEPV